MSKHYCYSRRAGVEFVVCWLRSATDRVCVRQTSHCSCWTCFVFSRTCALMQADLTRDDTLGPFTRRWRGHSLLTASPRLTVTAFTRHFHRLERSGICAKNEQEKNNNCLVKKCRREGKVALVGEKKEVKQSLETHDEEIVIANTATQTLVTGRSYHKCLSCLSAIKGLHDKKKRYKTHYNSNFTVAFLMNICSILREVSRGCASRTSDKETRARVTMCRTKKAAQTERENEKSKVERRFHKCLFGVWSYHYHGLVC